MASILSDEQLEALVCSECSKYLSTFPVMAYKTREVKCGRCNEEGDGGTKSLYELVVKNCLFKCVNRYEGCTKLLLPINVAVHEKECIGVTVVCPKCEDGNERSVLDLIRHYKIQHPTRYLRKNSYTTSQTDKDTLLYIQNDIVFFISLQYRVDTLYIGAATLTREDIEQEFIVIVDSNVKVTRLCKSQSGSDDCCAISIGPSTDPVRIIFNLDVSKNCRKVHEVDLPLRVVDKTPSADTTPDQFDTQVAHRTECKQAQSASACQNVLKVTLVPNNKFPFFQLNYMRMTLEGINGEKIKLVCSNCKNYVGQFVYKCLLEVHFLCRDCRNWCRICECLTKKIDYDLHDFVKVPCRWNCGQYSVLDHEFMCEFNRKTCPICFTKMQVRSMPNHFQEHKLRFSYKFNLTNYLDTNCHKKKGEQYFLLCHKLFNLQWEQKPNNPTLYELKLRYCESLENGQLAIIRTTKNGNHKYKRTLHLHVLLNQSPKLHLEMSRY